MNNCENCKKLTAGLCGECFKNQLNPMQTNQTPFNGEEIKKEWEDSEVSKRVTATELFYDYRRFNCNDSSS